jgi:hypothetical protein
MSALPSMHDRDLSGVMSSPLGNIEDYLGGLDQIATIVFHLTDAIRRRSQHDGAIDQMNMQRRKKAGIVKTCTANLTEWKAAPPRKDQTHRRKGIESAIGQSDAKVQRSMFGGAVPIPLDSLAFGKAKHAEGVLLKNTPFASPDTVNCTLKQPSNIGRHLSARCASDFGMTLEWRLSFARSAIIGIPQERRLKLQCRFLFLVVRHVI